jgi:hypothetical protein
MSVVLETFRNVVRSENPRQELQSFAASKMAHKSETETAMPLLNIYLKSDPQKLVDALKRRPLEIVNAIEGRLNAILYQLAAYVVKEKLSGQMLKRRTGILAGSVRVEPARIVGTQIIGKVVAGEGTAFYGRYLESGSQAHQIFAVKSRALKFVTNGKEVYAKSVMHPGTMAAPFMRSSLQENEASIREQLQAAIDAELQD